MKKIAYFIGIVFLAGLLSGPAAFAQRPALTKKEKRHLEQMKRKKEKTMEREVSRKYFMQLLNAQYFVFQADYLMGPDGQPLVLSPDINFMSVNGNKVVLQFGFNGIQGWNGLGGFTVHGKLVNYNFDDSHKNDLLVNSDIQPIGPGLPPRIRLNVSDDGSAELTIFPQGGNPVRIYGQIVSHKKANIYMGASLY